MGHDTLEGDLIKVRKHFDTLREQTLLKCQTLKKLKDGARDLELQSKSNAQEDTPVTRNIRMLENRLDKALIKFNEAQSIKRTYEQIVKRLREERIGFDHQLTALERTFAAKQRGYEEERRRRDLELRERHQMVQLRKQTLGTFQRHESARQQNIYDEHVPNDGQGPVVVKSTTLQRSKERTEQRTKIDI